MGVIAAWSAITRGSETGGLWRSMGPRMSAGWGNAVENSGLPRGKVGVTPWKSRGNAVEIWRWCWRSVSLHFSRMYFNERWLSMNKAAVGSQQSAFSCRLKQKQWEAEPITTVFAQAERRRVKEFGKQSARCCVSSMVDPAHLADRKMKTADLVSASPLHHGFCAKGEGVVGDRLQGTGHSESTRR